MAAPADAAAAAAARRGGARAARPGAALWAAARRCDAAAVRAALAEGADPSARSASAGRPALSSPMSAAAMCDSPEALRALLEARADLHATDREGRTALHEAVAWEKARSAEALCRAGAGPDVRDEHGLTPRDLAGRRGSAVAGVLPPPRHP
ncbi:unnamed protein product [Prorocentrum cordatum]|uniref:Uncharacterized protein n=1 Tax=Prorocentrum cordatum TaxID=2364126 RepID=A0ABN9VLG1_9DINO|nr:unnamed protein product [Polarella glacialis]